MKIIFFTVLLSIIPAISFAGVVGVDTSFSLPVVDFLQPDVSNPEYAQVFNYFVTLEIFAGILALFIRIVLRTFRM